MTRIVSPNNPNWIWQLLNIMWNLESDTKCLFIYLRAQIWHISLTEINLALNSSGKLVSIMGLVGEPGCHTLSRNVINVCASRGIKLTFRRRSKNNSDELDRSIGFVKRDVVVVGSVFDGSGQYLSSTSLILPSVYLISYFSFQIAGRHHRRMGSARLPPTHTEYWTRVASVARSTQTPAQRLLISTTNDNKMINDKWFIYFSHNLSH